MGKVIHSSEHLFPFHEDSMVRLESLKSSDMAQIGFKGHGIANTVIRIGFVEASFKLRIS